jgi:prepilin-type processing-associated H-X9-DG protein
MRFFTFNDFLVIALIVVFLLSLLFPLISRIRQFVHSTSCAGTLRELIKANTQYAEENKRFAPAAASPFLRWHGGKRQVDDNYDQSLSPFYKYVDDRRLLRMCPTLVPMLSKDLPPVYENGGWGFGYNEDIGSLRCVSNYNNWDLRCRRYGIEKGKIKDAENTIMFTDTATMINGSGEIHYGGMLAEHPFCRSSVIYSRGADSWETPEPTVHFRHHGSANIGWVDGHVSLEPMSFSKWEWGKQYLGFPGPRDDSWFYRK